MGEADKVVREFDELDRMKGFRCCWRVPNVWRQYRVGRKAKKCIQKIEAFRTEEYSNFIGVDIPPGEFTDDSWNDSAKTKACELQSRVAVMNEIMRDLEDESSQVVGVWGPKGAGKSMLIKQVLDRVKNKKQLQCVRVQVPEKTQDAINVQEEIQKRIFAKISPKVLEEVVEFKKRAECISIWFNSNKEKKAVIILEGLWKKIDLDAIGIPNNEEKVCDVILTARDMDTLVNDMGLSRKSIHHVGPLSQEESRKLFLYIVGRSEQPIDEEKKSVAEDLVKYCGGLPKLIEERASVLTNQWDIYAWHDVLRECKSKNIVNMLKPVKETLSTWSPHENDKKEIISLFSLCGLYGESSILVRDLIIHCWALGIFTNDLTVKQTKDRVTRLLHILRARSLVRGNNHEVEMTELLRAVAVDIACKENYLFIRNDSSYKRSESKKRTVEQLKACTALSIDGLDIIKDHPELEYHNLKMLQLRSNHHFPKACTGSSIDGLDILEDHPELEYHNLKMLQLRTNHHFHEACTRLSIDGLDILKDHPELEYHNLNMLQLRSNHHFHKIDGDKFFNRMKELIGLHLNRIDFVPSSFLSFVKNLGNLHTLSLDDCRLKDVRHIGNLKKLQILKISGSDIIELPTDLGQLTDLRMLDLRGCCKLQVIEHGVLGKLKQLEELYLDECFDKWEVPHYKSGSSRRNASLDELNEMNLLSTLHVYVPNSTMLPEDLELEKLEKYKILVGNDVKNQSEKRSRVRTLRLNILDSSSILCREGVKSVMHRTKSLYLKGMMRMPKPSIRQLCSQGFPCLKDLHLQDCDSIEYIVESSEPVLAFPNLETLTVVNLKNFRRTCNGPLKDESFGRLNAVTVEKCHALENLFDFSWMERISTLEKIEVMDCEKIKEIVADDIGRKGGTGKKIKWNKLRHLSLENLKEIVSFCNTDTRQTPSESSRQCSTSEPTAFFDGKLISFPGLESLSLIRLPKARKVLYRNIPPLELSNLWSLTMEGFEGAFRPTTQQEPAPRKLTLGFSCLNAQVDHDSQIQSPGKDKKHSALHFKALYPAGHLQGDSRHQNLRCLIVCGCETLKFLFTTSVAQELPNLTELTIAKGKMMEEIIQVDNEDNFLKSIELQELTTLCLGSLENLTTFSQGNISINFPSLKSLKISNCHKLTAVFTDLEDGKTKEEISGSLFHAKVYKLAQEHKHVSPSFPSLDNLDIGHMNNLIRIWRCRAYRDPGDVSKESALLETFLKIKKLHITDCGSLEKILHVKCSLDAKTSDNDNWLDAQLKEVSLKDLTNIEHIWGRYDPRGRKIRYKSLQKVSLCNCARIESIFPTYMANDLLGLQSLEVMSCHNIKHLIREENSSSGNNAPQFFYPDVKTLKLWNLANLMSFYRGPHCSEWPSLEELTVSHCDNFKIFVSEYNTSQAPNQASLDCQPLFSVNKNSFCKLSTLELSRNRLMTKILPDSSPEELFRNLKVLKLISSCDEPVILPDKFLCKSPHLESLQVHHVPIKISKTRESEGSPLKPVEQSVTERSLRKMELSMIPEMTDLKKALNGLLGAASYSFRLLTILNVSECHRLAYLFTYSTAKSLRCLTRLTMANCESMKFVVASEGFIMKGKVILDRLECLTLDSLQGLKSFGGGYYEFEFPSLEEVTVRRCSKMTTFSHGQTSSPNLIKVELNGEEIDNDEERNLNKIIDKELRKASTTYQHSVWENQHGSDSFSVSPRFGVSCLAENRWQQTKKK